MEKQTKMINKSINALLLGYCALGSLGGAGLGLISLGMPGMLFGFIGGTLLSYILHRTTVKLIQS